MEYENVIYGKEGAVATITLNHPKRLNAVSPELARDWSAALDEAAQDDDVKVIIIQGSGTCFQRRRRSDRCRICLRHEGSETG